MALGVAAASLMGKAGALSKQRAAHWRSSSGVPGTATGAKLNGQRRSLLELQQLLQNDVRSSAGDTAGPSQEALQGRVSQEIVEGESDLKCVCVCEGMRCEIFCMLYEEHVACWRI